MLVTKVKLYETFFLKKYRNYVVVKNNRQLVIKKSELELNIVETGEKSMTGGRLKKIKKYVKDTNFFYLTYGDGLANLDIKKLTNFHLKQDWDVFVTKTNKNISLLAKWIPREKSKFGWLFKLLVKNMFARYYETAKTKQASVAADKKARKEYRIICSTLNKFIFMVFKQN